MVSVKVIAPYLPLFGFIYHMENGSYKTGTLLHSPNPLSNFWCTPSLISHAPLGRASFPPGEAKGLAAPFGGGAPRSESR